MTREEIIEIVGQYAPKNPAFDRFVLAMRHKEYGKEETAESWYWFRDGWEAHNAETFSKLY